MSLEIKQEPHQIESETDNEHHVYIKKEAYSPTHDSEDAMETDQTASDKEVPGSHMKDEGFADSDNIMVKIELMTDNDDDNDDKESTEPQPVFLIKNIHNELKSNDKEKPKTSTSNGAVKPMYVSSKGRPENKYSEDIINHVGIITITEEQRQEEHKAMLESKATSRYICQDCALGFIVEDAYLSHLKVHSSAWLQWTFQVRRKVKNIVDSNWKMDDNGLTKAEARVLEIIKPNSTRFNVIHKTSPDSGNHKCDICKTHFKTSHHLYMHRLRHYRRYQCSLCLQMFRDRDVALCHVAREHTREKFSCPHCCQTFKRPQYLKRHVNQIHVKPVSLKCQLCDKQFYDESCFKEHLRKHKQEERTASYQRISCGVCSREYKSKAMLQQHLTTHEINWMCPLCGHQLNSKNSLHQHMKRKHGNIADESADLRELTCPQCHRVLSTPAMLTRHILRMHVDRTKKFQCDHCQHLYYTKGELRAHIMWSHLRARGGHACACGLVFRTPARLRDHANRKHLQLPPPRIHPCKHCQKSFQTKQLLNRHLKIHTDETYPCNECGMKFKTKGYVNVHYKLKHMNMTRAEIRAQAKRRTPMTVEEASHLKYNTAIRIPKEEVYLTYIDSSEFISENGDSQNSYGNANDDDNSVESAQGVQASDIKVEDIQTPLFQTFIDVKRE